MFAQQGILNLLPEHWPAVREIYLQGIATRTATFQTDAPDWNTWDSTHRPDLRFVYLQAGQVAGWAALSPVSGRCVYAGVSEVSIYVHEHFRAKGIGKLLLQWLIDASEQSGIWTLQSGIFPENTASIRLHEKHGFRTVGYREMIGKLDGVWRDTVLMERRSKIVGIHENKKVKNILVLCTGNSCRSQLAEAYLRHFADGRAAVYSAGIEVHGVNPRAVETMKADGIDISTHTSNHVEEYATVEFDYVITVCDHAKEVCPFFPTGAERFHQNFPDPAKASGTEKEIEEQFNTVREMIKQYSKEFIENHF